MMEKDSCMRSVEYAAELAGGYDELAARLRIDVGMVLNWSTGRRSPDTTTYLFLLDFIMEETRKLSNIVMASGIAEQVVAKARKTSRWH